LVTGILTAPKSGKETRTDIKNAATRSISETEKQLKKLHTELHENLNIAKERTDKLRGKASVELNEAMEQGKGAKEKVRDILSSIHEGQAHDKDLGKAVKEAQKAVSSLKKFLSK
jgi:gas vesicle protein